jgi:hypothetical protein
MIAFYIAAAVDTVIVEVAALYDQQCSSSVKPFSSGKGLRDLVRQGLLHLLRAGQYILYYWIGAWLFQTSEHLTVELFYGTFCWKAFSWAGQYVFGGGVDSAVWCDENGDYESYGKYSYGDESNYTHGNYSYGDESNFTH